MKNFLFIFLIFFASVAFAADTKMTALPENTAPISTDILHLVDDPGGTPANQYTTVANLLGGYLIDFRGLSPVAGDLIYFDGANFIVLNDGAANTLLSSDGDGTFSWLAIGTDVQAYDSALDVISGNTGTVDNSGVDWTFKSVTVAKVSGTAGLMSVKEANSTDTDYIGWMGPASITESFSHQFSNTQPSGSFYNWAAPSGTGDPNGNKTSSPTLYGVAIASDINTGTATDKLNTPDAIAGSNLGTKEVAWTVYDSDTDTATGDGKQFFIVPASLNGMNLIDVTVGVHDLNSATGGTTTAVIRRVRTATAADMLSTGVTVDYDEYFASDGVIDTSNDDIQTGDRIFVDVDAVTTGAVQKGLSVTALFRLP